LLDKFNIRHLQLLNITTNSKIFIHNNVILKLNQNKIVNRYSLINKLVKKHIFLKFRINKIN